MTQQAVLNQQKLDDYAADDRLARAAARRAVAMLLEAGILEWKETKDEPTHVQTTY